jgi:hypothetical protein
MFPLETLTHGRRAAAAVAARPAAPAAIAAPPIRGSRRFIVTTCF